MLLLNLLKSQQIYASKYVCYQYRCKIFNGGLCHIFLNHLHRGARLYPSDSGVTSKIHSGVHFHLEAANALFFSSI